MPNYHCMRLLLLVLLFLSVPIPYLWSQRVLSLENKKKFKRIVFKKGDFIRFRTLGEKIDYNGSIEEIGDSTFLVVKHIHIPGENEESRRTIREIVRIEDVSLIYYAPETYWRALRRGYYRSTLVAGGIIIGGNSLRTLLTGETPSRSEILLATGILTSGLIVKMLGKDVYKIGKKWELRSIKDFSIPQNKN